MTNYDCKAFANELPDLVLTPGAVPSAAATAHLQACPPCTEEYLSFQSTFQVLDSWTVPAPTAFFDQKLAVRLREEQAAPAMGWLERLTTSLSLNTGRTFRPMLAGALSLLMLVGGGGAYLFNESNTQHAAVEPTSASATVNDLQIFDRNEQAFHQMDLIEQDETTPADTQQTTPAVVPES